jgi:catechol 2,3-dioxygenase-like lactoylglutathione lyase family enzyme
MGRMGVSIHHIDLAVSDVESSLAFYLRLLGPFGLKEAGRFPTYRGTEEVVYLAFGDQYLGLRQADGGETATTTRWASSTSSRLST